jgi:hypothetical protein
VAVQVSDSAAIVAALDAADAVALIVSEVGALVIALAAADALAVAISEGAPVVVEDDVQGGVTGQAGHAWGRKDTIVSPYVVPTRQRWIW